VLVFEKRDLVATRRFFTRALMKTDASFPDDLSRLVGESRAASGATLGRIADAGAVAAPRRREHARREK